jgi:hypothetical protein
VYPHATRLSSIIKGGLRRESWSQSSSMLPKKDYRWKVYHIKNTPAKFIGTVTAPGEETALRKAVAEAGD